MCPAGIERSLGRDARQDRGALIAGVHDSLAAGRFEEALARLPPTPLASGDLELAALRRLCLARSGRVSEAADLGAAIAARSQEADDWFRCAQLANALGKGGEALPWALRALAVAPFSPRYVEAAAHAALLQPQGIGAAIEALRALPLPGAPVTAGWRGDGLLAAQRLPYYAQYDSDHHAHMGWVTRLRRTTPDILPAGAWRGGGGLADILPAAAAIRDHFQALPHVEFRHAAEYAAVRLSCLLVPEGRWPLEFVSTAPLSLGQRPWVFWFDILSSLFNPFASVEDMRIDDHCPWYRIVKTLLEAPACRAICSHYPRSKGFIGAFFQSRIIAGKTRHVGPCDLGAGPESPAVATGRRPAPGDGNRVTLLFTNSRAQRDAGFYFRGGVDVLNGFERLAGRFPDLHLILRSPLPATLSQRLRTLAMEHPRIRWLPDFLAVDKHHAVMAEADILVMPGPILYRNGVTEALRLGIVPILGDPPGIEEVVEDGVNVVIVRGRRHRMRIDPGVPELTANLSGLMAATDRPADPAFFESYVRALEALVAAPNRRARLSRAGMAVLQAGPADLEAFERVIAEALHPDAGAC